MYKSQARSFLGEAFGPGDLANHIGELISEVGDGTTFDMDMANQLIDWMAERLTDEDEVEIDE